jgi:hypothetical protein
VPLAGEPPYLHLLAVHHTGGHACVIQQLPQLLGPGLGVHKHQRQALLIGADVLDDGGLQRGRRSAPGSGQQRGMHSEEHGIVACTVTVNHVAAPVRLDGGLPCCTRGVLLKRPQQQADMHSSHSSYGTVRSCCCQAWRQCLCSSSLPTCFSCPDTKRSSWVIRSVLAPGCPTARYT